MRRFGTVVALVLLVWPVLVSAARAEGGRGVPDPSAGPGERRPRPRWTFETGVASLVEWNTGGSMVTLYGASVGVSYRLLPALELGLSSTGALTRRGGDNVWTLQIHHYTTARARLRLLVGTMAALGLSAGGALVVEHHRHQGGETSVWASAAAPAVALGLDLTALAEGFGVRFHADGWVSELGVDIGAGTRVVLPF